MIRRALGAIASAGVVRVATVLVALLHLESHTEEDT